MSLPNTNIASTRHTLAIKDVPKSITLKTQEESLNEVMPDLSSGSMLKMGADNRRLATDFLTLVADKKVVLNSSATSNDYHWSIYSKSRVDIAGGGTNALGTVRFVTYPGQEVLIYNSTAATIQINHYVGNGSNILTSPAITAPAGAMIRLV